VKLEQSDVQAALESELGKLEAAIPYDGISSIVWKPGKEGKLAGEVSNGTIYVYDEDLNAAIDTLKHEYIDCYLTRKIVNPLTALVNLFVEDKTREIYKQKERIVDVFSRLIENSYGDEYDGEGV
jgi:hypothetical protein